jgi:hypothetical protein
MLDRDLREVVEEIPDMELVQLPDVVDLACTCVESQEPVITACLQRILSYNSSGAC